MKNEVKGYIKNTISVSNINEDLIKLKNITSSSLSKSIQEQVECIDRKEFEMIFNAMNKPLKFKELRNGDWIWDSFINEYIKLDFMFENKLLTYHRMDYPYRQDFEFEYGRYYRYKPL